MIHGVVKGNEILPIDPIPPEWADGRHVVIEAAEAPAADDLEEIESWFANLAKLGPARYEPGEREAIERLMQDADWEAKESMRRSWAKFHGTVPPGHQSPQRGTE